MRLDRVSDFEFEAKAAARQGGTYAVGLSLEDPDGETIVMSALATRSFAAEYLPGEPNTDLMESVSSSTGGRGEIQASQAFDPEGLAEGITVKHFRWWFLLAAAMLWPIDVALRRLRLSRRASSERPGQSEPSQPTPTTRAGAQTG